jgi:hypothetical protein
MAIQTATNPQTGERVALVGDEWQPIAQTATNKAGVKAYLVGDQWIVDDTPVAKATPKAAPKPTQAAEPVEYDFGAAMAADIAPAETPEKKVYTGSVFDTQPFDPKITPAEADRLSRRAYAEATTKLPSRTQYARATPQEQLGRTTGQAALDTTIGLLQGAAAFPKGLAGLVNAGDNPVAKFYESAIQAGQKSKSPYLQSQIAEREAFIKNVTANQGEVGGARASFNTMFSPAGADIVAQGAGSMIPTVGLSMLKLGQMSMGAVNALAVGGEAAQSTAQKLSQMSPENWSNSTAYQELRSSGMSHQDAANMLAPLFAMPNQFLGMLVGKVSGSTGLETRLAGKAVTGGARERAARAGTELLGEQVETLVPSFVANVTQRIFDDKQSLTEGLGKAAVETTFGTIPGAALAATGRSGKLKAKVAPVTPSTPVPQQQVITPVQERVEPTFDAAEFDRTAPPPPTTPTAPAPVVEAVAPTEQVKAIAERLQKRGISRKAALAMAEREVKANEPTSDETGGAANVAEPIDTPSGEGVSVAGQPSAEPPAGGTAGVDTSGVVLAGQDVAGATTGKGAQPTALEEKSISFEIRSANNQEQSITSGAVATLPLPGGAKAIFTQNGDGDIELIAPNGKAEKVVRAHDPREGAVRSLEDFPDYVPEPLRQLMLYYQRAARENYYAEGDEKEATQQRLNEVQDEIINTAKSLQTKSAEATPEKATTLYHGTNTQYETIDPSKSGGMAFFGEDLSTAQRYAQNGGGGRARLDNTQKYIVDRNGVVYELDGETWKAVGVAPDEGLINQDTIQPLDKAYPSLSQAEAEEMTNPDSGTAGVVPKTSRIITQDFSGLKLLDISTPEGRDVIAGLTPTTGVGIDLVDAAKFDARDKTDRNSTTQLNSNFWGITKYAAAKSDQLKKDIVEPLKALGYDGIRFADDQHSSVGLFDTGLGKTKGAELGTETSKAVKTTQKGQEAPPTGGVTKGKTGPKPKPPEVKEQIKVSRNEQNRINNDAEYNRKKFVAQLEQTLTPEQIEELSFEEAEQAEIDARQSRRSALRGLVELQDNPNIARGSAVGKRISAALKDSKATEAELADIRRGIKAAKDVLSGPKEDVLGAVAAPGVSGKTESKASKSADVKVDKPDAGFSKLTTGSQAIAQIIKNGSLFQRFVAQRIRNFMVGVKFVVVEEGDATPANILAEMEGARGLFVYTPGLKDRTIYVRGSSFGDLQGINNVTVLHELLHAATASRITAGLVKGFKNASLQKFMREMSGVMKSAEDAYRAGIRTGAVSSDLQDLIEADAENVEFDDRGRPKFQIFNDHNEFLAYGMSSPEFQKFLMGVQGVRKETSIFSRFTNSIRDLFGIKQGDATAFSDLIDITDKMLDTRLTAVEMKRTSLQQKGPLTEEQKAQREKEKAVTRALKSVDRSFEAEKISEETEVLQRLRSLNVAPVLKEAAKGMNSLQRKAISKALSTPLVAEIGGVNVPELINTNRLLEQMDAAKMEMLRAGAKLVDDIKRLLPTEESREKVSRAALVFTASRVDPRVDKSVVRLNKIYDDLTADEKKALDEIAGYYGDIMDNYDYLLGENVKALRPGEAAKLTAALREALGKENRIPFYVPLARDQNGEFYLRVGTTEFHIRKTEAERDRLAESIAEERNTTVEQLLQDKEIEVGNDIEVLRKKVLDSSDALRRLFIMIEDADFTAEEQGASLQKAKDGMKDSVFQLWLHMQPESSSRKQFIHRNKYPPAGFRTDVIQNLAESVLKFSNNMARLEYAPQLRRSISQAQASIENRPAYAPYVSEMALRVNDTLAPDNQSIAMGVARFGNSFTFGYYMSESTALLQLLSVYQVGTAQLAKQYPMTAVAKEMAKMSQIWNTIGVKNEYGEWVMPTIEQALNLESRPTDSAKVRLDKEQDRAFIDAMHERNVSESTGARDLQGYKDLPTEKYGSKYERAKRVGRFVVGGLIHATERLSREFMFMSSAHLIRDKAVAEFRKTAEYKNAPDKIAAERAFGIANLDTWADKAAKDTNAALFNYSESAKPRYMRGAVGRVALQFFTYQLNVGSFIARNFIGMIKPLPGETRVECMRAFSTLMATTFSLGGTQALFGGPIVLGFISLIMKMFKGEDEPDELKDIDLYERFKIFLHEQLGDVTVGGKSLAKIVDQGPLNAFTGLDVSSRISVSNILTPPEVRAARTSREGVLNYAQLYGGANLQAVLSLADGVDLLIKGEHYRGFEKLMPWAALRNKMVAVRQYTEGEKSLKLGDDVVEAELFYMGELVGQAVGLRPVLLSDVAAANRKAYEVVNKVVTKRQAILDRLDRADRKGDDKAYLAALEEQGKFNAKVSLEFPRLQISEEDRYNFIEGRNEARRTSFGGFQYTPQNEVMAEQITNRSREALVKREKEIEERRYIELRGLAEKNPR